LKRALTIIAYTILFVSNSYANGKNPDDLNFIFINSFPLRAKLVVNGKETSDLTPFVIKDKSFLKNKSVLLRKEGYKDYYLTRSDIASKNVDAYLIPISFDLYFPEKIKYYIGNTEVRGPVYVSKLSQGRYDVIALDDKLSFRKVSNFVIPEAILGTAFGISFAGLAGTIGLSEYFNYMANDNTLELDTRKDYMRYTEGVDIAKYASIVAAATFGVALISVIIADAIINYKAKKEKMQIINKTPAAEDSIFFETAINFLATGEIGKSTNLLLSILNLYPQSDLVPKVYYMVGQNYFLNGDFENAERYWDTFIGEYPVYDYYDYVLKSLSDIYYSKKDYKMAINLLDRIVFSDNVINRETVYSSKAKIYYDVYVVTNEEQYYVSAESEYTELINRFVSSERLDLYFAQLIKLYKYKNDNEKLQELYKKAQALNERVGPVMKNAIISLF